MSKYTAEQVEAFIREQENHAFVREDLDLEATMDYLRDYAAHLRERESVKAGVTDEWVSQLSAPVTTEELKRAWNMIGQAHPQKEWVERALIGFIELRLAAAPKRGEE